MAKAKDLTGQKFSNWIVVKRLPNVKYGKSIYSEWLCQCRCGSFHKIKGHQLTSKRSKQCRSCYFIKNSNHQWNGIGDLSGTYWSRVIKHAKSRNLKVKISIKQAWNLFLKQNRKCALSGLDLKFNSTARDSDGNASLDRIDSSKGYTLNNIQWVDKTINRMKVNLNEKRFIQLCKLISMRAL